MPYVMTAPPLILRDVGAPNAALVMREYFEQKYTAFTDRLEALKDMSHPLDAREEQELKTVLEELIAVRKTLSRPVS